MDNLIKDPKGPKEGSNRVYRGGSWYYGAGHLQSFIRFSGSPGRRRKDLGFRLVRTPKSKTWSFYFFTLGGNMKKITSYETKDGKKFKTKKESSIHEKSFIKQKDINPFSMEFVNIKSGKFLMGSPEYEKNRFGDEKQHEVEITKDFEMQVTPVTQIQWQEIMGNNPSYFKGPNNPVETVSWNDVKEFIKKLNEKDPNYEYRLPTEAEWEYACRAGTKTSYSFGDEINDEYCWYYKNSDNKTHPVGQKKPNAFGLYDMHGNVWEWCQDWYGNYE